MADIVNKSGDENVENAVISVDVTEVIKNGQTNEQDTFSNEEELSPQTTDVEIKDDQTEFLLKERTSEPVKKLTRKEKLIEKYGIDINKKIVRKPSVYGNFIDISDAKNPSERKHVDPWLQDTFANHPKKKVSPTKDRTAIRGVSRSEWLKKIEKKMAEEKLKPIKKAQMWLENLHKEKVDSNDEEEAIDEEIINIDKNDTSVATSEEKSENDETSVDDNGDGELISSFYLDSNSELSSDKEDSSKVIEVSQFKDLGDDDDDLDMLITQGANFNLPVKRRRIIDDDSFDEYKMKDGNDDD
uniref:SWR1-complex protein 5 n=1 Tax=Parastrongyloides trichosuri TaxID=131310 RepID=A0A0N5A552_PARTI